ncbi:hypothetical protein [Kitasatospora sp. NPDC005748]|uniref:hypothetical protein n=1 Tax=Kitasatospora sp. NPDC005748 TaxID=3157063 RepID=UPI0033C43201
MEVAAAAVAVLSVVEAAGDGATPLHFARTAGRRPEGLTVSAFAAALRERVLGLASLSVR